MAKGKVSQADVCSDIFPDVGCMLPSPIHMKCVGETGTAF